MPQELDDAVELEAPSYDLDALKAQKHYLPKEPLSNIDKLPCPPDLWDTVLALATAEFGATVAGQLGGDRTKPVRARFLVLHDTAGTTEYGSGAGESKPDGADADGGIHLWVSAKTTFQQHDWHVPGYGTKLESRVANAHFLHVELSRDPKLAKEVTFYNATQYRRLACAYLFASARAGRFITVTAHNEVDRACCYYNDATAKFTDFGHNDPENFALNTWYKIVSEIAGLPTDSTFGIEASRANGKNMGGQKNVFIAFAKGMVDEVAQYGPAIWVSDANSDRKIFKKVQHPKYGEYYDLPIGVQKDGKTVLPRDA